MDQRGSQERSDPRVITRVFFQNLGALALYMIPCGWIAGTTTVRHATAFTYAALLAFLGLPLVHGIASLIAGGALRRRGHHDLGAGLRRSGAVILAIWLITWVLVIVLVI